MEWGDFTNDQIEQLLVAAERKSSELYALKLDALAELDRRQAFTTDGARNLSEWTAAKLDVGLDTARGLVRTMRRTETKPNLRTSLAEGDVTFDRAQALSKLSDDSGVLDHLDIASVRRIASAEARTASDDVVRSPEDRYLVFQPSLDESWWQVRGGFDGVTGAVVDRALTELADDLPTLPDGDTGGFGWRKATALYVLSTGGSSPEARISVFVDAARAAETTAESGVMIEAGPNTGSQALSAIMCDSVTEVTVNTTDGVPLKYGRSTRAVPPALRRAVLARTGGFCAADGCDSRYRVEAHHITPWSQGGTTDPDNLIGLCWFHHHVIVHERGYELFKHPNHGRIRFRKPTAEPQIPAGELVGAGNRPTKG